MSSDGYIHLHGVRQNNLRNLDVRIPRHRLVVVTGPSGSGKSSLVFDTLYAEGQRRYLESLSAYARQFLEQVPKPAVDRVEGLSPALAIEQKGLGHNPRSTVGTVTEILPFLRLLFARLGHPHCPRCGVAVGAGHPSRVFEELTHLPAGTKSELLAPVVAARKGEQRKLLAALRRKGFVRVRVNGELKRLDELEALPSGTRNDVDVVVDRLVAGKLKPERMRQSIERALEVGGGVVRILLEDGTIHSYSTKLACPQCGSAFPALEPRLFSFNAPTGACASCKGSGSLRQARAALIIPDETLSIRQGALAPLRGRSQSFAQEQVEHLASLLDFSVDAPVGTIGGRARRAILDGTQDEEFRELREGATGAEAFLRDFEGLRRLIERRAAGTKSARVRKWCESFLEDRECARCKGSRLSDAARAVKIAGQDLATLCAMDLPGLLAEIEGWDFAGSAARIGEPILDELKSRIRFLLDAGVGYLSLDRGVNTLSGGEGQRVRLATQVGSKLTGVLYILDEPSVGLHARDTEQLIELLMRLRDRGNSVIVVEHDRDIIEAADHIFDMGPGAGADGGEIVAIGTPAELAARGDSPTGRWLAHSEPKQLAAATETRAWLSLRGVCARNLKNVDFEIPLGKLVAITGVSGSGKSTAVHDVLHRALARHYHRAEAPPLAHASIEGLEHLSKVILIDQAPIGRSPRSTPATFTGVHNHLRKLLAQTPAARSRGFEAGRFSFNTKGGRCEPCAGAGVRTLKMDFLPEVQVRCDECGGKRFDRQTLEVSYKGHNIADFLEMEIDRARELLQDIPPIRRILDTMHSLGLGYLRLGQRADSLSGGEAQRVKLAKELARPSSGETLYILDEPTTGLHFADVDELLGVLRRLVDLGNTVVVVEHHPDLILAADHIIDLGPEGGEGGGEIVVAGPVQTVVECDRSYTGRMLKRHLSAS